MNLKQRLQNDDMLKGGLGLIGIGFLIIIIDQLMSKLIWWVGLVPLGVGVFFIIIDIFAVDEQQSKPEIEQ